MYIYSVNSKEQECAQQQRYYKYTYARTTRAHVANLAIRRRTLKQSSKSTRNLISTIITGSAFSYRESLGF